MSQGTDIVRFAKTIECFPYSAKMESSEGIMVVYKTNIEPYTFTAYTYSKELFYQRSYSYIHSSYLLGSTRVIVAVPMWEVHHINRYSSCYSSYTRVINGDTYVSYHQDSYQNYTMWLSEDDYYSANSKRYITVREHWHKYGSTWIFRETCSMNCIVTVTTARSKHPYDFFVLSSGVVVEGSPFFDKAETGTKYTFNEDVRKLHMYSNYSMLNAFGKASPGNRVIRRLAFLERADMVVAWEVVKPDNVTCPLKRWETVERAVRSEHGTSLHFVSKALTATFVAKHTQIPFSTYNCISQEANTTLDNIFEKEYNDTHEKHGDKEMYVTTGGLVIVWQGVKPKPLAELERLQNVSGEIHSRRRRSVDAGNVTASHKDITYAQLQFTYDTLRTYINHALGNIAEAWCVDQKRTSEVLHELSKINPSNILSAIYDTPVAARTVGDVIAVAKCIDVEQDSVQILRDMRILGDDGKITGCYSRPIVRFRYHNRTEIQSGQLGENNEILLGTFRTEQCQNPSFKIFVAGNKGYEYRDYKFKSEVNLSNIDVVNTMIKLNIEPLENTDFKILELYSEGELKSANVFNLEDIMREYNAYKQTLHYIEGKVGDVVPPFLRGLDDFISGLGAAGKGIGMVMGAIGGVVASAAGSILSFFTNPFGTVTVTLIVVAVIVIAVLVYQRQKSLFMQPFQHLFPYVTSQTIGVSHSTHTMDAPPPYSGPPGGEDKGWTTSPPSAPPADVKYNEEDALQMLKAIQTLDEKERSRKKEKDEKKGKGPGILDRLRRGGYSQLPSSEEEETA